MKVRVTHDNGGTKYHYPSVWIDGPDAFKYAQPFWLDAPTSDDEFVENGEVFRYVYLTAQEASDNRTKRGMPCQVGEESFDLYVAMMAHPDIFCEVAQEAEVRACSDKYCPVKEVMTDQEKVLTILAKQGRGEVLTQQEKDALDPSKEEKGINMTKNWCDHVKQEYGVTWPV